jgi:hypothetical protein
MMHEAEAEAAWWKPGPLTGAWPVNKVDVDDASYINSGSGRLCAILGGHSRILHAR